MEQKTLYERLGGASGIPKLVDDIVGAHMANVAIKARFLPFANQPEQLNQIKAHLITFLGAGSGGPEQYQGRSMPDAHRGMNINEAEYMAAVDDILNVVKRHGIDEASQKDVLAICYSLKDDIMRL